MILFTKVSILFVCMGNLCRSPTAEAVFAQQVASARLKRAVRVASAGTHVGIRGDPADLRAVRAAARRGYDMSRARTRPLQLADFRRFDYLLAMDQKNLVQLQHDCPRSDTPTLELFTAYGTAGEAIGIPDPYYGAPQGFERVLDMVEDAAQGLLRHIREQYSL